MTICIPKLACEKKYKVSHMYGGEFVVDLRAKTCFCRRWDLCGIPCSHAISCIYHRQENVFDYAHECYSQTTYLFSYDPIVHPTYLFSYDPIVHPVPSMDQWKKTNLSPIRPPPYKTQPGRPKKSRNKDPCEVEVHVPVPPNLIPPNYIPPPAKLRRVSIKIRCSICGQEGHNKRGHFKQGDAANSSNQEDQSNGPNGPARGRGRGVHRGAIRGGGGGIGRSKQPSSSSVSVTSY
ncbi:hypothetical protein GBA52_003624 [Prunus armeniaca]|nr:hypothetical protein GBA52_003624 [Prunus armeniaca]